MFTKVKPPDVTVVLAERKLTSYVYAVVAAEFEKKCSTKFAEEDDLTDFEVNEDNCDNQVSWMESKHMAARAGKQFESLENDAANRAGVRKSLQKNITKPVFSFPEFPESVLEPVVTEEDAEDVEEDGKED
ncbi:hypothetical protein TIFTF001_016685 [Ficus carica]|uniref:Uncharacterized protein n=1 Tax=Ficus carica TaxID=3494 RepID=A0AA88DIW2_FICCA|nr:hypothetical protein TIFTF001_016685 [Ficus carica]